MNTDLEKEVLIFLTLCTKNDAEFMNIPRKKRSPQDYARLIIISFNLGLTQISMMLVGESEKSKNFEQVMEIMEIAKADGTDKKWIADFLKSSPANKHGKIKAQIEKYLKSFEND